MKCMSVACVGLVVAACSTSGGTSGAAGTDAGVTVDGAAGVDAGDGAAIGSDAGAIGGDRPVSVHVPPGYVQGTAMPLVILLHGYGSDGARQERYMQFQPLADARGFLYATPDGTVDAASKRFWEGTDACCDLFGSGSTTRRT